MKIYRYANWATRAISFLGNNLFINAYLSYCLELNQEMTHDQIHAWMIPVAATRLEDNVPGERTRLLQFIATNLKMS